MVFKKASINCEYLIASLQSLGLIAIAKSVIRLPQHSKNL